MDLPLDPDYLGGTEPRAYREAALDIETSSLSADQGRIIVACVKPLGEGPIVLRMDEYDVPLWDDGPLVKDLLNLLSECVRIYTWYGQKFDIPFIRTRKILRRVEHDPVILRHADLYVVGRRHLKMHNHRLATYMSAFSPEMKLELRSEVWRRAAYGDAAALNEVVERCKSDVTALEPIYIELEPHIQTWRREEL
jgi:uncharacterized protein YprB with RNaseH-like and TPR domain